ncbi:lipoprotein [Spiroplasma litorale]|uniref:Lipoprotein n=1 Tax=Spiroplasma litorale TaxID=216942 RepID=A0A0K1W1V6_9MOLU|nr:hypothetical protein [Spiroplasma litorale]AKX34295.1 lipoprotein [Spiroplasma litorale]
MKKLLKLLLSFSYGTGLIIITATSVSCSFGKTPIIKVQTDYEIEGPYTEAINEVNRKFEELGVSFRAEKTIIPLGDNIGNINKKGIRERSIPDVFSIKSDQYNTQIQQGNILELNDVIKKYYATNKEDQDVYQIKYDSTNDKLIDGNTSWKSYNRNGIYYNVPASIENILWVYNARDLTINTDEGYMLYNGKKYDLTIDGITKLNTSENSSGQPIVSTKIMNSYETGAPFLNIIVNRHEEEIKKAALNNKASVIWNKSQTEDSRDKSDYDSIFENKNCIRDLNDVAQQIINWSLSTGNDLNESLTDIATSFAKQIELIQIGQTSMSILQPVSIPAYTAYLTQADKNKGAPLKALSLGDIRVKVGGEESKQELAKLSGFQIGSGMGIKTTIDKISETTNNGEEMTKKDAAAMIIRELTQPRYSAQWVKLLGRYSPYEKNKIEAQKYLEEENTILSNVLLEGMERVYSDYQDYGATGIDKSITFSSDETLIDIYWDTYHDSVRLWHNYQASPQKPNLDLNATDANGKSFKLNPLTYYFINQWKHFKELYVFG